MSGEDNWQKLFISEIKSHTDTKFGAMESSLKGIESDVHAIKEDVSDLKNWKLKIHIYYTVACGLVIGAVELLRVFNPFKGG